MNTQTVATATQQKVYVPIITSLLDNDMYKFTMGQFVWKRYKGVKVKYALTNRTKSVKLEEIINEDELYWQLEQAKKLHFTQEEISWLGNIKSQGQRVFSDEYLEFLENVTLPDFSLRKNGHSFDLHFEGPWELAIYWEVIALAIVNELYSRAEVSKIKEITFDEELEGARQRLYKKIDWLRDTDYAIMDFGTRRRFSRAHQRFVVSRMKQEFHNGDTVNFLGTSNMFLAKELGLQPLGTMAHELFMFVAGLAKDDDNALRASQRKVLDQWWDEYGAIMAIALSDTFGTESFFDDLTQDQICNYRGFRQDSGDPIEFGKRAIAFWQEHGIDPKNKVIVFSDGLDIEAMDMIWREFNGKVKIVFGWGTNLTFDFPGIKPLSLVIKAIETQGYPLVKLSDNPAKAIGKVEQIERYKRVFGYGQLKSQECVY